MGPVEVGHDRSYAFIRPDSADRALRLWTVRRIPFETEQTADQKRTVAAVGSMMGAVRWGSDEVLRGVFVSGEQTGNQPDAENIVYYNFHCHRARAFANCPPTIRFERSYAAAPPCEVGLVAPPPYYDAWAPVSPAAGYACWKPKPQQPLAEWESVPCNIVEGEDAGRNIWLSMCEHNADPSHVIVRPQPAAAHGYFAVQVTVHVPHRVNPADAIKGCVDGPIASFQRFAADDSSRAQELAAKFALWKGWRRPLDQVTLLNHMAASEDATTLFPEPPFNGNGLNPCDKRCVAGEVKVIPDDVTTPLLAGKLYLVEPLPEEAHRLA